MNNFLTARWENLIMANYAVDPAILKPYLPAGVELDFYKGNTYVSLVGFMFKDTKIFKIPIPGLGTFEEVNLRFYVTRKDGNEIKRGVVFINETVPYKIVAWLANLLYKEHYTAIPTQHNIHVNHQTKRIEYLWKIKNHWSSISVTADIKEQPMLKNSFEEFIFEHYFGYTRVNEFTTEEYKIEHPRWNINAVNQYQINCDFEEMYGKSFHVLNKSKPYSVMLAQGSSIAVKWKRTRLKNTY